MSPSLAEQLANRIRDSGPLPFDHFMEQALYHPEHGFYASGQTRTGTQGDFLTPVSPGPVLGELLARQVEELHKALDRPPVLDLVEQGADAGWLARDLLLAIRKNHPDLFASIRMHLLEPHPVLEKRQRETMKDAGLQTLPQWHTSWENFPKTAVPCFFFSCELVDSFPVRIFQFRTGAWRERLVGTKDSRFLWQDQPVDPETRVEIQRWNAPEVEGHTMELRPGSIPWVQGWAEKIPSGMVLTLDYGFPAARLFSPFRDHGTLVAIRNHRQVQDPLADPGELDLTAHVNFTELEELARNRGFTNYGLTDFARGLTALAAPLLQEEKKLPEPWIRNFRHLTHPSFFGQNHKILVQGKSLPSSFTPSIVAKF